MPFPDIFDQTVLTEVIRREWEELAKTPGGGTDTAFSAAQIVPMQTVNGRNVKIRIQEILPFGMTQPRAPGASPALWTPRPTLREQVVGIVDWDEAHLINDEEMLRLSSPDPNIYKLEALNLAQRGAALKSRLDMRTEWIRWQTLRGVIVVNYPGVSAAQTINYGIPAGHFPAFGTAWTDLTNADPIEDLYSLGAKALTDAGIYLPWFHMNDNTFRLMRRNKKVRDALSSYGRSVMLPNTGDLSALMRSGEDRIIQVNSGWLPENSTSKVLQKWINDGEIFACPANYTYLGRRLADVADGWVLVKPQGAPQPQPRQGEQSEIKSTEIPPYNTFLRQVASRIGRLWAPEAIVWGTAYTP